MTAPPSSSRASRINSVLMDSTCNEWILSARFKKVRRHSYVSISKVGRRARRGPGGSSYPPESQPLSPWSRPGRTPRKTCARACPPKYCKLKQKIKLRATREPAAAISAAPPHLVTPSLLTRGIYMRADCWEPTEGAVAVAERGRIRTGLTC
jgi:hypothetical protein